MDSDDTPNVFSRQTIFVMNIMKPCFTVTKVSDSSMDTRNNFPISKKPPGTEKAILHRKKPCSSTTKSPSIDTGMSSAGKRSHPSSAKPKVSPHVESLSTCNNASNSPGNKSIDPESVQDVPVTESMVKDVYADVFQGLGKFPGKVQA